MNTMNVQTLIKKLEQMPPNAPVIVRLGFLDKKHLREVEEVSLSHWHGDNDDGEDRVEIQTNNHQEPPF